MHALHDEDRGACCISEQEQVATAVTRNGDEHGLETPQLIGNGAETKWPSDGEDAHHERARRSIHAGLTRPTSETVDSITRNRCRQRCRRTAAASRRTGPQHLADVKFFTRFVSFLGRRIPTPGLEISSSILRCCDSTDEADDAEHA